jgi:hypothetical protein
MNAHNFSINAPINPSALLRQQTPLTVDALRVAALGSAAVARVLRWYQGTLL